MISLLTGLGAPIPTQQETLNLITEKKPAIVQVVEPTLEEKIKTNYYKCDTNREWIWAQDATCHPKVVEVPQSSPSPTRTPQNGSTGLNGYDYPSCTGHVASLRYVPPGWGDASGWRQGAINAGWTVSDTPVAGAIAWRWGHVAYVMSIGDGVVTISENNYDYNGSTRVITVPTSTYTYLY